MPLMKCERRRSTGPATCMSGRRRRISSYMIRISMRAKLAPRQKCGPPEPKLTWAFAVRGDVPDDDLVAFLDGLTTDLGVLGGRAPEAHHRRAPAQDLLDCAVH